MRNLFFDTSALVKRYHQELGTDQVDRLVEDPSTSIIVSSLSSIETVSAFKRRINIGDTTDQELVALLGEFFRESLEEFVVLPIEESLARFAFDLILDDDLRTLDSLQLSAGLAVSEEADDLTFVTADHELARIARHRGLDVEIPQ